MGDVGRNEFRHDDEHDCRVGVWTIRIAVKTGGHVPRGGQRLARHRLHAWLRNP